MEKSGLPFVVERDTPPPARTSSFLKNSLKVVAIISCLSYLALMPNGDRRHETHILPGSALAGKCQQVDPIFPAKGHEGLDQMWEYLSTESFRNGSIARHSGAVQIRTESFDDLGKIGEDKRWDVMYKLAEYLEATFPRTHKQLKTEKINTHGLLYTWEGSDKNLKPLLLMAHQDVVPVPESTVDAWTHPPFSGYYDGKYIWGRGASDCKNQLIAVLETVELLLDANFEPKRTIILSFGFDEEISGTEGAGHLAPFLLDRYGKDGVAAIVDEGAGFASSWGSVFALPGVGEKGYTDVQVTVRYPGGHSSVPTDHTSIGIISEIITAVESWQYPTYLADENPVLGLLQCGAAHAPEFPKKLKKLLAHRVTAKTCKHKKHDRKDALALAAAEEGGRSTRYLMQTSQAVDLISGGVKINALPERVQATINHRINIGDTPEHVYDHLTELIKPIAKKYNLTLHAFDGEKEAPQSIQLKASDTTLIVAPLTPTEVDKQTPYSILSGTVRALYGTDINVSPGIMQGNTDTRYTWDLTRHIFRFGPGYDPSNKDEALSGVHTVDEKISVVNHINAVKWFTLFIRNMDVADLS